MNLLNSSINIYGKLDRYAVLLRLINYKLAIL